MQIKIADVDNIQSTDFKLHRENGSSDYLFVLFKSAAKVFVGNEYVDADRGSFILFDKRKIQSYYPCDNKEFLHDFMHFDTETDEEKRILLEIPKGRLLHFSLPHTISSILLEIKNELNSPFVEYKKDILTNLGTVFLYRIKSEIEKTAITEKSRYLAELRKLRSDVYCNPQLDWSVENMCQQVCLSRSYFQSLYKKFFSVSCNDDVINARIALAKTLLASSSLNVNEIAEKCGYANTEHFIRQFKKKTGISPKNFQNR